MDHPHREMAPTTVLSATTYCLNIFDQYLKREAFLRSIGLKSRYSPMAHQKQRFSRWAFEWNVFSSPGWCLDHRLRGTPDYKETLVGQIKNLAAEVEEALSALDRSHLAGETIIPRLVLRATHYVSSVKSTSRALESIIDKVQIPPRVEKARLQDSNQNDIEESVRELLGCYVRESFPKASGTIQQRLEDTMMLRYKVILYWRLRYAKHIGWVQEESVPPTLAEQTNGQLMPRQPPTEVGNREGFQKCDRSPESPKLNLTVPNDTSHLTSVLSIARDSREVTSDWYPPAPVRSIDHRHRQLKQHDEEDEGFMFLQKLTWTPNDDLPGTTKSITDQDRDDAVIATGEHICPFCVETLPARFFVDDMKWKAHLVNDLQPYVCLIEDCETPNTLYYDEDVWLRHMHGHSCDQPRRRRKRCECTNKTFKLCPLCGAEDALPIISMENHIAHHLKRLGLLSLPAYDDKAVDDTQFEILEIDEFPQEDYAIDSDASQQQDEHQDAGCLDINGNSKYGLRDVSPVC